MYGAKFNLVPVIKVIDSTNTYEAEQAGKFQANKMRHNKEVLGCCSNVLVQKWVI